MERREASLWYGEAAAYQDREAHPERKTVMKRKGALFWYQCSSNGAQSRGILVESVVYVDGGAKPEYID